jgi:hypothetical protein
MDRRVVWAGGLHWSYTAVGWCGFFASLSNSRVLLRHELTWTGRTPEEAAEDIREACRRWQIDRLTYVAANPELWPSSDDGGETPSETFARLGVPMRKGHSDRVQRFSRVRSWLAVRDWPDGTRGPSLLIHTDAEHLLRTLPTLVASPTKPDDVHATPDEYPTSGLSYYAMSRPLPAMPVLRPQPGPGTWGHALRGLLAPERPVLGRDNLRRSW